MKKIFVFILIICCLPLSLLADSYQSLWKQVNKAENSDLPQTQIRLLKGIAEKARTEKMYGQLLKAELMETKLLNDISTDSLKPAIKRIEADEVKAQKTDVALAAVYDVVLGKIYNNNPVLSDKYSAKSKEYFTKAMANPIQLAAIEDADYEPLVTVGKDAKIFDNDLLSVIGMEVQNYKLMHAYYVKTGNRQAACITAILIAKQERNNERKVLNKSVYLQRIDSIINKYKDLREAGEGAIEHYDFMSECTDATVEDKIHYINYALKAWGNWPKMNILRNAMKELTAPTFSMEIEKKVNAPEKAQTVRLNGLRNITGLTMTVSKFNANGKNNKPIRTITHKYIGHPDYEIFKDSMILDPLPLGAYVITVKTDPETEVKECNYYVSGLMTLSETLPDKKVRYVVVNATTGQPVAGAKLKFTDNGNYGKKGTTVLKTCDNNGEVVYKYSPEVYAYTDEDKACPPNGSSYNFNYYQNDNYDRDFTSVFTDREIYRPGQTVHVAAIIYKHKTSVDNAVVADKEVTMTMRDANHKIVSEKKVTTDKMGTCTADFTLPTGLLNGRFSIRVDNGYKSIKVEEYKRPTFEVEMPKLNAKYQNGDTLIIKGHARSYAGVAVQGAKVAYKINRRIAFWWRMYSEYYYNGGNSRISDGELIKTDTVKTDDDGCFSVVLPLTLPIGANSPMFYNFDVTADVTDMSGETHSGELIVPLGNKETAFSCNLPKMAEKENPKKFAFRLRNASGMDIDADVTYYIDNSADTHSVKTQKDIDLFTGNGTLASGNHQLVAICENDTLKREFIVFSTEDTKPCVKTNDWFYISAPAFTEDNKPVTVQVGSSAENTHILYSIISGNNVLERGAIDQSNALWNSKFRYKDEYGDGILLTYAWVKDGICYSHTASISRPIPNKHLNIKWTTFRDRLTPGQKETWTLNVTRPDNKITNIQMMATLYDKALDQIVKNEWNLCPTMNINIPYTTWYAAQYGRIYESGTEDWKRFDVRELDFSHIDDNLIPSSWGGQIMYESAVQPRLLKSKAIGTMSMVVNTSMADEAMPESSTDAKVMGKTEVKEERKSSSQIRENLSETAFFYPNLNSDSKGNITIKFTLPESITTWRFMGIAHTEDMCYAMTDSEAVAKKEVMIQPNMPRFVRMGDNAMISAKVMNTSEKNVKGTAKMELLDPETERVVYTQNETFNVAQGETGTVNFNYTPDNNKNLYICRITANGKSFSDGEQHYLPVLDNRERVTVTVPFSQNGAGTKTINVSKLFPVKDNNNKLTVEYTNNPAWMMVQALPSVANEKENNAIDQCASYYVNSIAKSIVDSNPKIKSTFNLWKTDKNNNNTLTSSLNKNEDLKDIMLKETPWVNDADNETEQKERIADFFDESGIQNRLSNAINKLQGLQNEDGSWSWWQGMDGSMYMTTAVTEMLVRLNAMKIGDKDATRDMLNKAFKYMDRETVKNVELMKEKKCFPYFDAIHYLYICALGDRQLSGETKSASDYLISLMKKEIKDQSIYEKALSAIVLYGNGEKTKAAEYVKSLKEYSVITEEKGRYYDTQRAGYSWCDYKIPTEVAAIEAIKRITPDDKQTVEEMQRWLIQEKRTQCWNTPINSINAIYAFLYGNDDVLNTKESATLTVDGKKLTQSAATAGMGYVKTSVSGANMNTFSAVKTSKGTSWGAVYAQYMQKTSDVEESNSGLSIKREIISGNELNTGDKITVRITIKADRDFDFVQVQDKRAACMEPVRQLSGYNWGYYISPKDCTTDYFFDMMTKGTHVIETEYYIDRSGKYETGTCTAQCAYAPEYKATAKSMTINVK